MTDNTAEQREHTILAVDDNEISQKLLDVYITSMGHKTVLAEGGPQAIELLKSHDIDLIFLDLHMPVMDGFETTKTIRKLGPPSNSVPIIGLSADSNPDSLNKALQAGMNQYLVKPIKQDDLQQILDKWLQNSDASNPETLPDDASLTQLQTMLLKELPEHRANLENALKLQNLDAAYNIAHKIAGGSTYCNLPELEEAAKKLQISAKNNSAQQTLDNMQLLIQAIDKTITRLSHP